MTETLSNSSSDFVIKSAVQDKDIIFKGDDGGSVATDLTLDMSDGTTFNGNVTLHLLGGFIWCNNNRFLLMKMI